MNKTEIIKAIIIVIVIIELVVIASVIYFKINNKKIDRPKIDINNSNKDIDSPTINNRVNVDEDEKPIIYLYPTTDTKVTVELGNVDNIAHSYPKYNERWNVLAKTNGTLIDLDTNRELYSLYYECENKYDFKVEDEGFVVNGEDTISFLEEKLLLLGLNAKEAEEFIIYWLPRLEVNKYNYIRFATKEEIESNMPISYSVMPDSEIRILMTYKPLDCEIKDKEQELINPHRTGITVVEWGGTRIK